MEPGPKTKTDEGSQSSLCYACGSCLTACPVNLATNRLQPRKLVMMANWGWIEELLELPEIWYCLSCRRCNHACPMTVKPEVLIARLRSEAIRRGTVRGEVLSGLRELQWQLHRVRLAVAERLLAGEHLPQSLNWREMAEGASACAAGSSLRNEIPCEAGAVRKTCGTYLGYPTHPSECLTCGECRNACPACRETAVFDPMWMVRMMNLGFAKELFESPMMWLCIDCESCTRACTQRVRVHLFIRRIQQIALREAYVNAGFPHSWKLAQKAVYSRFLEEIDVLLTLRARFAGRSPIGSAPD